MGISLVAITISICVTIFGVICVLTLDLTHIELSVFKQFRFVMKAKGKHFDSRPTKSKSKCPKKKKS